MRIECKSLVINNRIYPANVRDIDFYVYPMYGKASFMRGFVTNKDELIWTETPYSYDKSITFEKLSYGNEHDFISVGPNDELIVIWKLTHRKIHNYDELNVDYHGTITIRPFNEKTRKLYENEIKVNYVTTGGVFELEDSEFNGKLVVEVEKDDETTLSHFNFTLIDNHANDYVAVITSIEQHQI